MKWGLCSAFLAAGLLMSQTGDSSETQELRETTQALRNWLAPGLAGTPEPARAGLPELIRRRAILLSDLLRKSPGSAYLFALSQAESAALAAQFPEAGAHLEAATEFEGTVEVWYEDDFERGTSRLRIRLRVGSQVYDLDWPDAPALRSGARVRVKGILSGGRITVLSGVELPSLALTECTTTGDQKTVVLID
jgi:hypothetical protein